MVALGRIVVVGRLSLQLSQIRYVGGDTGYEKAAIIAKKAFDQNKTIRQILLEMKLFPEKKIDQILNLKKLT